ncbi:MAG: DUF362 domain-containing protein [Terriglobia bacterium]
MGTPFEKQGTPVPPQAKAQSSNLDGIVLQFKESMSGFLGVGESDPRKGAERGRAQDTPIRFDVQIRIIDLGRFLRTPEHQADLAGTVTFAPLGEDLTIRDGLFNLFTVDPQTGIRQMTYAFRFRAQGGQTFYLHGHKEISDDPGKLDIVEDMTRLFTTVYRGEDEHAPIYGAGELYFKIKDAPALVASLEVPGATSWRQKVAAFTAFGSFAWGALRDEYLKDVRLLYDTQYDNLVLAGTLQKDSGDQAPFFFVSGVHEKGFPWGDNEIFWDVLLAIGDGKGGYRRYCITDRVLEGLELDIETGVYRYRGPLFEVAEGYAGSFSQMRAHAQPLAESEAEFDIDFETQRFDTVPFPVPLAPESARKMSSALDKALREALPGEHPLGIHITPHTVTVRAGRFRIRKRDGGGYIPEEWEVVSTQTFGESEHGTFRNVKEPTLLYGYLCALRPAHKAARIQILSRTLRNERERWIKDRLDAAAGALIARMSSAEMLLENGKLSVRPLPPAGRPEERATLLRKLGDPVLEVNNDHFPTGVFQRRIVEVQDPSGERCLALEEDMSMMRLEAIETDRKVTVASIRDEDKFAALDRVLEATGFDALVEGKLATSRKARAQFLIVIKPNFMFAYDKRDQTTYTDPKLVHHLVKRLRARGFETIRVVEAQSTYGEYFDKRSVREMADYLGYDGRAGYEVVDMTLDAVEKEEFGPPLGFHPVSQIWREADFRISFAKNKTHAYAYYTLTLKNIYGALPLANKFKEYHCAPRRDIYGTTIQYLKRFPVDYGLVDAFASADGPFGIFADPTPNETHTIIGGADLVAVDWVAATKMGIDPMISKYMELAVNAFGKPEIHLVGDRNPYRPWLNVPVALTLFTRKGLDADYHFGNLFYTAAAQMDETHFQHKDKAWHIRLLRSLTVPMRRTFFLRTGERPSLGNRIASWLLYRMGF